MSNVLTLAPAGPIAQAFTMDKRFLTGIMGPVGSAKTTHCIKKCVYAGLWQKPVMDPRRGPVRRAKGVVIRDTYPNLDATVIESWHRWFPASIGRWVGDAPRTHDIVIDLKSAGWLDLSMIFIAIGDKRVEDVLRGLEVTFAWLNEADRLSREVLDFLRGRVGRYPGTLEGGCAWSGIFADFNAPDVDNYTYEVFVEKLDELTGFHRQPSGLDPKAENIVNLPGGRDYYLRQRMPTDKFRRLVMNEFGYSRDGQPVYPEFQDVVHVAAEPLKPLPDRPLIIGLDGGLTPAAAICQRDTMGGWRILDELCVMPKDGDLIGQLGPTRFAEALTELLAERYPEWLHTPRGDRPGDESIILWADPATNAGTDKSDNEETWLQIVARILKRRIRPAPSNSLTVRLEAVRTPMTRLLEGGRPGFLLSPRCKVLRRGFNAGYHYKRVHVAGPSARTHDEPNKNEFSHVQDALQYAMLGAGEGARVLTGRERRVQTITVESDYDHFGDAA